jgi:hypothetical protein
MAKGAKGVFMREIGKWKEWETMPYYLACAMSRVAHHDSVCMEEADKTKDKS